MRTDADDYDVTLCYRERGNLVFCRAHTYYFADDTVCSDLVRVRLIGTTMFGRVVCARCR